MLYLTMIIKCIIIIVLACFFSVPDDYFALFLRYRSVFIHLLFETLNDSASHTFCLSKVKQRPDDNVALAISRSRHFVVGE
jgi:hypothetical protein